MAEWQQFWLLVAEYLEVAPEKLKGMRLFQPTLRSLQSQWAKEQKIAVGSPEFNSRLVPEWALWVRAKIAARTTEAQ